MKLLEACEKILGVHRPRVRSRGVAHGPTMVAETLKVGPPTDTARG
jgi:hypothetical protein